MIRVCLGLISNGIEFRVFWQPVGHCDGWPCLSIRTRQRLCNLGFLFALKPETIAALYKARWEIELFFKWIKQNLRVKAFYGTSPNAVKTQIRVAMTVYLTLAILKQRYQLEQSLSQLLHFLEVNLFEQKPLISIFQANARLQPKEEPPYKQLRLFDV